MRSGGQRWLPWLLLAPALAVLGVLLLWPLARMGAMSLQNYGMRQIVSGITSWVGLSNYLTVFGEPRLWRSVLPNTVGFAACAVLATVVLGTLVALLLARVSVVTRTIVGSAIMAAWAMPAVTGTYVWVWMFDADAGIVNRTLAALGLIRAPIDWFAEPLSFYGIVLLNVVHHGFPFVAITMLAGILGVSKDLLEAAAIDGAGALRRLAAVTLPAVRPVLAVVVVLSIIWDFKVFAQVYLMPGGSGSNREVLNLGVWSFVESFEQNKYGLGSSIAVLLTLLLLGISVLYVRVLRADGQEPR